MSFEAQRVLLVNKMKLGWGSTMKCAYPNQAFNIPANEAYAEFHIVGGPKAIPIGSEGEGKIRTRRVGFVQLTVWVPQHTGTKKAGEAGDKFAKIFQFREDRDEACFLYRFGLIQDPIVSEKAGWDVFVFRVPFEKDGVENNDPTIN